MPALQAVIRTQRASRYLDQLCRHLDQMRRMRHRPATAHHGQAPPPVQDVSWSDTSGVIRFSHGTCTLLADPAALTLRIDAADEDNLRHLRESITRRVETIGGRERLTLDW